MSTTLANTWSVTCTLLGYIPKSLYGRILRKRLHLLSLPMELLEEVVKNLGWLELLRVRITCKTLYDISKIRSVRVHLVKRAQACDPYHTPMDRAIEHHTADELEDWAMRRLVLVDQRPATCAQQSFRQRSAYLTNGVEQTILLPGGRWLVSSLKEGGLVVSDLDSPEMRHQSIWEPQEDVDKWPAFDLVYCVDEAATTLTFDLALHRSDSSVSSEHGILVKLYFWRVYLSADGMNFTAQLLNSFWTSGSYPAASVTLTKEYFARIGGGMGSHCIEIFHWRKTTSDTNWKSSLHVTSPSQPVSDPLWSCVRLLPEYRVLVVSDHSLSIYHLPEMVSTIDIATEEGPIQSPIHNIPLGGKMRVGGMSRLITDWKETRLVAINGTGIYEFVIPHALDLAPSSFLRAILQQEPHAQAAIGLNRAILRFHDGSALPFNYSCGYTSSEDTTFVEDTPSIRFQVPRPFMAYSPPKLDEGCQKRDWKSKLPKGLSHKEECKLLEDGKEYEVESIVKLHNNRWSNFGGSDRMVDEDDYTSDYAVYGQRTPPSPNNNTNPFGGSGFNY
ncbi:hypothetical protein FIBSPDRAFT_1039985 [Athelia psychrophila]|uniref:F-box domain-containing protein n=1 Tax=Athelia psychrophila TaxID=1759441 RepID=A0A166QXH6_9AGAM|nr:hypothetical protein FIBSPDRAFT_1039985 [Fibularhizoctonia sp. CBS 109695]